MHEEELKRAILTRCKGLDSEALEKLIQDKLKTTPFLTRLGALLIILEEQGLAGEVLGKGNEEGYNFTHISSLTTGLQDVSIVGRALGFKRIKLRDGRSAYRLRLWDGTGAVDVIVWENFENLTGLSLGDAIAVWNGFTSSPKAGRSITLQAGIRSRVEKLPHYDKLPKFEAKAFKLPQNISEISGRVDFSAVVVFSAGFKRLSEEVTICEVVISDGEKEALFTAWGEWAKLFSEAKVGQRFFAASTIVRNGELSTGPTTCISLLDVEDGILEKVYQRCVRLCLRVVGVGFDGLHLVTDGAKMMKLGSYSDSLKGEYVTVEKAITFHRRSIPYVYGTVFERDECEIHIPQFNGRIEEKEGRIIDGILTFSIVRKAPLTLIDTKYGRKKVVGLWVGYGGKTYSCSAWGKAADYIEKLMEGTYVKVAFPLVKKNRAGEPELSIDDQSYIKELEKL